MLIENFVKDKERLDLLRQALSIMFNTNFFGVMLEIASKRSIPLPSDMPIENAALRSAWHNGYVAALNDIYSFHDLYAVEAKGTVKMDFGSLDTLLKAGDITQEEYDELNAASQ